MAHHLDTETIAVVAACVVIYGLVSARLERWSVTAPIAFVIAGLVVAHQPVGLIVVGLNSSAMRSIAEITLAVVLFSDASRVNVNELRSDARLPICLLGIGLPLTIALGFAAASLMYGGNLWVAAVIGASVAPTDAALGASIMQDKRLPRRIRRVINVESGLNDGIATPFVTSFIAAATATAVGTGSHGPLTGLAIGVAIGVAIGAGGALLLRVACTHGFSAPAFRPFAVLGLALLSYSLAVLAGGNGFVAAFLAGLAFGSLLPSELSSSMVFTDEAGEGLSLIVWFLFGAAMVVPAFEKVTWQDFAFAVAALTVVRMLPVALALIGSGLDRRTVAFVGWFGPRGLASVVFALLAYDALEPADANRVLAAVTVTVLLSVLAHGLSASPLTKRYAASVNKLHPAKPEHQPAGELRTRSFSGHRQRSVVTTPGQ